jgi:methyl-accepting chemotaxis protein
MSQKITLYRENEKKINKIYLYLLSGGVLLGALLVVAVILFTPHKASFSFWYALGILAAGAALISIPAYLIRYRPDSRATKYFLIGGTIGLVVFVNIYMAKISENNFMNFFGAIVFASLYFNKKTTIFAVGASAFSYLLLVIFIPGIRPVGFQSVQGSVAVRLFYLGLVGIGSTYITILANNLLQRITEQEKVNQENLRDINNLLKEVAIGGNTFSSSARELLSITEETSASLEATGEFVKSLGSDAIITREGMTRSQQLLNSLAERADDHQDLSEQTLQLTENITTIASQGSENVSAVEREINQVVIQFGTTLETIEELNQDSQNIGEIVQTISNIAEQTKMLSMNASIEAARAGEYGRGFAVVAQKIGKLSVQTQETLKQIETIIKKFLPQLETTVNRSKETAVIFERGISNVKQINESFIRITHTLQEGLPLLQSVGEFLKSQADIIKEIGGEVTKARDFSVESEAGMKDLNEIFQELTNVSQNLISSTQQLGVLGETLTAKVTTRFSEAELQASVIDTTKTNQSDRPTISTQSEEAEAAEAEFNLDDFDLDALVESLEISLTESKS